MSKGWKGLFNKQELSAINFSVLYAESYAAKNYIAVHSTPQQHSMRIIIAKMANALTTTEEALNPFQEIFSHLKEEFEGLYPKKA